VRALEAMRGVCRGTLVLIECLDPQLELLLRVPAARLHPHRDEWWRCNSAGLVELVQLAGFEVSSRSARFVFPLGPGAPRSQRLSRLGAALAGRPLERGNLARVIIARPRPPNPDRVLR
jgi:hypothetical protein